MFDPTSGLNTFDPERVKFIESTTAFRVQKTIDVTVMTVDDVVDKYCSGRFPDFLSLDVEGLDYRILQSINYDIHRPAVICVETSSAANADEIHQLLAGAKYTFVMRSVVNMFFADALRYDSQARFASR